MFWLLLCLSLHGFGKTGLTSPVVLQPQCPHYAEWSKERHEDNRSAGRYQLPFQRPSTECRSFYAPEVEEVIERLNDTIKDPDLFRLFENAYPNTLDTAVRWKGFAWADGMEDTFTDEDLAFIITRDMYVLPLTFGGLPAKKLTVF